MHDGHGVAFVHTRNGAEPGVAVARWDSGPTLPNLSAMAREVSGFAVGHGMRESGRRRLELVMSEAVAACAGVGAPAPAAPRMTVEAATDGIWLSVRVTGTARWDVGRAERRLRLAFALADRIELAPLVAGDGISLLMEISMAA